MLHRTKFYSNVTKSQNKLEMKYTLFAHCMPGMESVKIINLVLFYDLNVEF